MNVLYPNPSYNEVCDVPGPLGEISKTEIWILHLSATMTINIAPTISALVEVNK